METFLFYNVCESSTPKHTSFKFLFFYSLSTIQTYLLRYLESPLFPSCPVQGDITVFFCVQYFIIKQKLFFCCSNQYLFLSPDSYKFMRLLPLFSPLASLEKPNRTSGNLCFYIYFAKTPITHTHTHTLEIEKHGHTSICCKPQTHNQPDMWL